jgi:hypothetical protein
MRRQLTKELAKMMDMQELLLALFDRIEDGTSYFPLLNFGFSTLLTSSL